MMRVRRASVIVALFLLASARTALAECAWVLWQFDGGEWTTLATSHQRTECDRDRVRHYGLEQAPPPGIGTVIKGKDGKNFFMRLVLDSITSARAPEPAPPTSRREPRRWFWRRARMGRASARRDADEVLSETAARASERGVPGPPDPAWPARVRRAMDLVFVLTALTIS